MVTSIGPEKDGGETAAGKVRPGATVRQRPDLQWEVVTPGGTVMAIYATCEEAVQRAQAEDARDAIDAARKTLAEKRGVTNVSTFSVIGIGSATLPGSWTIAGSRGPASIYGFEKTRVAPPMPIPKDDPLTVPDSLGDPATRKIRE